MKNISYVINGILAVAIIILFILFFTTKKNSDGNVTPLKYEANDSTVLLPIAYVNVDSLLLNYKFAIDANDRLMKKLNSSNNTVEQRQRQLDGEYADYQRKAQNNAFLSPERAQQEANRIQKLANDFQLMAQRLDNELNVERANINTQVADSVRLCIKEYNKSANYQVIFTNNGMDNILTAKDKYDITADIIKLLNSRYNPEAKK